MQKADGSEKVFARAAHGRSRQRALEEKVGKRLPPDLVDQAGVNALVGHSAQERIQERHEVGMAAASVSNIGLLQGKVRRPTRAALPEDLDGHLTPSRLVQSLPHMAKGALAQGPAEQEDVSRLNDLGR